MKHFTIGYKDDKNNFFEICEYAERSDEAIKNAINDIPILKRNKNYIFRCTNESDLEWLSNMETFRKKEWDKDLLIKEAKFILRDIKNHLMHIYYWLKKSLRSNIDL